MNKAIFQKLTIGLMLAMCFALISSQAAAQSDERTENAVATSEESNTPKPGVNMPALTELNGITLGMTTDEVRQKLGDPETSDATSMLFISDNGETIQLGLGADKKVKMVAVIYSGKNANAPEATKVFGADSVVQPQTDGRIYKRVRYPSAGYWVAYSRLNLDSGPMTTVTMQKIDVPK